MSYKIEAYLDDGIPSLEIYDIEQKSLCLSWRYNGGLEGKSATQEVHQLFHKLLLLTCKQDLNNIRVFSVTKKGYQKVIKNDLAYTNKLSAV